MERQEKIDTFVEFLEENRVSLIDKTVIGAVIIDVELTLSEDDSEYERDELIEKGFEEEDIDSIEKFLENKNLMMVKADEISGVSLENCEYELQELYDTDIFGDSDSTEEDEDETEKNEGEE